ncbi:hypothetical protein [Leadbettera azotonutricia]|uniref:Six-hairpin glycosidase n=1 Tax=Leadbettera azotonutricia (strain ATCC BAA-888 / DSM 13862 / ZAS-9) TaxID=545695 RepID=F5Y9B7_LEAAZ|nr:hypothetical protein [Leadbettera azotonutricia]AEF81787.1 conserved hypothetical protein [Leadbettera azotonutricia ZAS-9]
MENRTDTFTLETQGSFLTALRHPGDSYAMNWIEGSKPWGTIISPEGISSAQSREITPAGAVKESYTFANTAKFPVFTVLGDIGIYAPFNDSYDEASICLKNRCHAHIWCGGTSSYAMCLRMNGQGPHLGLILTKGSLGAYSVERDLSLSSNDRGDFILHPAPIKLESGETYTLSWELFWHQGKDDFYRKLREYPSFIEIEADHFVIFEGEKSNLGIKKRDNQPKLELLPQNEAAEQSERSFGEQRYTARGSGVEAWCRIHKLPPLWDLAEKRCAYIVKNQQHYGLGSPLDGAYLIYDNEEGHSYYGHRNDHNGGRERIAMGVLIARYLRRRPNADFEASLKKYVAYALRELFDSENGTVFNDINRDDSCQRLYNYPWFARFLLELNGLWKESAYLRYMFKALNDFYVRGGQHFYAIGIPMAESLAKLEEAGLSAEAERLKVYFLAHADAILQNGLDYPAHEVKYEQSIVASAADILFQAYRISKEAKYLEGAKKQLETLALFNGRQPDSRLYETAIRHWDGYWFGKRQLYGDTFPHYWSALTGMAYAQLYKASGDTEALDIAEHSLRGVLGLFAPDGSASCARLYPLKVNGAPADFLDPWANDQDWGLYYALKFFDGDY